MQNTANAINQSGFQQDVQHGDLAAKYRYSMRSSGATAAKPQLLFIFRCNNSDSANRLQVNVDKTNGQVVLGQYVNGSYSNLATAYPLTINYDTDYDVQVVADGMHVEVWWGPAGGDMAKIIEVDSAAVMSGPRLSFLATANTVVRVDNINITTPDTDRTTYTYNNGNELLTMVKDSGTTTFTYDDWGRQVSKIVGANSAVYTYRFGSMLKEINSTIPGEADLVQYTYDAFYKRREVRVTEASVVTSDQWYRYDIGFNAIARYDDGDLTDWVVGTRNQTVTYTGMTPLSEVPGSNPSSGSYRHYVHDHLGSTRALYDGSKVLLARQAYTPYGEQAASTAGVEATYSYTGKPWEEETGLYFFPIRYYSPRVARWAWRDPLGMADGKNVYIYSRNRPIERLDRLGMASRSWPLNGQVCNDTSDDLVVLSGEGTYCKVPKSECTRSAPGRYNEDVDGVWICGKFYKVGVETVNVSDCSAPDGREPVKPSDRGCKSGDEPPKDPKSLPECRLDGFGT